ncbi:sulfite exporter TauE/SafE family protein, partial [Streptomyces sp. 5-8]|nr:sulfite exporter TauE/SafE family protein [Streptomyces musisoli]
RRGCQGIVVNVCSLAANGVPRLGPTGWASAVAAMIVGAVIGKVLSDRVPEGRARQLVLMLALAGGLSALAKGLAGL